MLQNDKLGEDIDWSQVYRIEEDVKIDLSPNPGDIEKNTRRPKDSASPLEDRINQLRKTSIENEVTPNSPKIG